MIFDVSEQFKQLKIVNNTKISRLNLREVEDYLPQLLWENFKVTSTGVELVGRTIYEELVNILSKKDTVSKKEDIDYTKKLDKSVIREACYLFDLTNIPYAEDRVLNAFIQYYNPNKEFDYKEDIGDDIHYTNMSGGLNQINNYQKELITDLTGKNYVYLEEKVFKPLDIKENILKETIIIENRQEVLDTYITIQETLVGNAFLVTEDITETYKIVIGYSSLIQQLNELYGKKALADYRIIKYITKDCDTELNKRGYTRESIYIINGKDYKIARQYPNGTYLLREDGYNNTDSEDYLLADVKSLPFKTDILHEKVNKLRTDITQISRSVESMESEIMMLREQVGNINKYLNWELGGGKESYEEAQRIKEMHALQLSIEKSDWDNFTSSQEGYMTYNNGKTMTYEEGMSIDSIKESYYSYRNDLWRKEM